MKNLALIMIWRGVSCVVRRFKKQAKQLGTIDEEVKKCGNDKSCLKSLIKRYRQVKKEMEAITREKTKTPSLEL